MSNVNQFVEDEDEESFSCAVRISAQYLIMVRAFSCIINMKNKLKQFYLLSK